MKNIKRTVLFYVWAVIYSLLGLTLAFLIFWNIGLAFKWDFAIELRELFNTDVRNTAYYASTSLLLQVLIILVAGILIACLIINDNHAKRVEKMKRKLKKSNERIETIQEATTETEA